MSVLSGLAESGLPHAQGFRLNTSGQWWNFGLIVSALLGITPPTLWAIMKGITWTHVTGIVKEVKP
jgi:hypothetical protein